MPTIIIAQCKCSQRVIYHKYRYENEAEPDILFYFLLERANRKQTLRYLWLSEFETMTSKQLTCIATTEQHLMNECTKYIFYSQYFACTTMIFLRKKWIAAWWVTALNTLRQHNGIYLATSDKRIHRWQPAHKTSP